MASPSIQWYPGHIARAEKQLRHQLDRVDLVLEVCDARILPASRHPSLERWVGNKPRVLVVNRRDMVPPTARSSWHRWLQRQGEDPIWCDGRGGGGSKALLQATVDAGAALNVRRQQRGLRPRPVRALVLGFPNVGKSALINRLVGRRAVASERRAGVTRSLQWVRMGGQVDLLDAPGILPPRLQDQQAALLLAICDDIGQAAYDHESVAQALLLLLANLAPPHVGRPLNGLLASRYGVTVDPQAPHRWLQAAAAEHTSCCTARMAQRLLDDFRKGCLGAIALQMPRPSPQG
ncbi:MAG: GTPase [Candidatus Synechococcus spongiarum SP3]|uniref:Ribosome biogenesis GTPase A n=1 Tax=Candidatus Synechococcus spongiarum SP3 TaxID=1604020 RepID=A0A0G2IVR6_9SYNE|nr:MAG: GTPase [Candidatus Synechococcus spongiarum SP3]